MGLTLMIMYLLFACNLFDKLHANVAEYTQLMVQPNITGPLNTCEEVQQPWISLLFTGNFNMHDGATEECKKDFRRYNMHLRNKTVWAIRSKYIRHLSF